MSFLSVEASNANWKLHPIFDEEVTHVIETPDYVYFTSRNILKNNETESFLSLFRYDKKGEEITALSTQNILNGNTIKDVVYNPSKGYVAVLYPDYNIDLIYNNGKVENIPYYAQANVPYSKEVNHITVDPQHDRLYLATDFGYVAINDKKKEIAESRLYRQPLTSFCRVGDVFLATMGNSLLRANADSPVLSLDQFNKISDFEYISYLYPLNDSQCLIFVGDSKWRSIKKYINDDQGERIENINNDYIFHYNIENNADGVTVTTGTQLFLYTADGVAVIDLPEGFQNNAATTSNMADVWIGQMRKGLGSVKRKSDGWSITRDWMLPNAPATFVSTNFLNHPSKGFLMLDYGMQSSTVNLYSFSPLQISGLKSGRWTQYAPAYTNPDRYSITTASNGMAIDPDNNSYVYITSYHNGLLRLNLDDPKDIIHLSCAQDADFGKEGFVVWNQRPVTETLWANISLPFFDSYGNLWMVFTDLDHTNDGKVHYYCWTAQDRRATSSATNIQMPQAVEFDGEFTFTNNATSIPLKKTGKGIMVYSKSQWEEELALIDTNGTPVDTSDDQVYKFTEFIDSDGNYVELRTIKFIWEDPSSGYVWLCHSNGVCYFSPSKVLNGDYVLNRIKVSRNDGTNLADYLLDGVTVNQLAVDGQGRKWFALDQGGVVCTSADGREIIQEFTTTNSPLPDNQVFGIGYNTETNSLMFSTLRGYAEYFLPLNSSSSSKRDIKAYPNPVRPEYSGYVTISEIPEGSFVKITDIAGNLVKDLGIMSGFEMLWDLSDSRFNRVKSGVYHIMVSPSDDSSSFSAVGKILVIS